MASTFNHRRLQDFLEKALRRIESTPDLEEAIAIGQWLATYLWKNHLGVYRWDAMEETLITKLTTATRIAAANHVTHEQPKLPELHVATEVYAFGGHSSLLRHLVKQGRENEVDVLVTHSDNVATTANRVGIPDNNVVLMRRAPSAIERIYNLNKVLQAYQQVVLHIHPNDLETALAVRMLRLASPEVRVHFVNHADHAFSVGIGSADRVLEISQYGWALRKQRSCLDRSSFLGIPINFTPKLTQTQKNNTERLLTGGASFKFQPVGNRSLPKALVQLLGRDRRHLDVVGPKGSDWWWWPLKARFPSQIKIHRLLPKERYQELLHNCCIYIDSYPLPGGTALPEALMMGCKVAGMRGLVWGYSPADELLTDSPKAFTHQCRALSLDDPDLLRQQEQTRLKCILHHSPEKVRQRLEVAMHTNHLTPPPLTSVPEPSPNEWEHAWRKSHAPTFPSRRESMVSTVNRKWLAKQHLAVHGLCHRSAWRLLRHALSR